MLIAILRTSFPQPLQGMELQEKDTKKAYWRTQCNLIKTKKIETKYILIDEKTCNDVVIYFTRYVHRNSIKILSLHYHELMWKIRKPEEKKYLVVDYYMLLKLLDKGKIIIDKVIDYSKEIRNIEKFQDTKILIDTDDILADVITFKNIKLITYIITDDGKFYEQIFSEESLFVA